MKKKRILIFSLVYAPFIGGAELALEHLVRRFDPDKWEFDILTLRLDSKLPKREQAGNIRIIRLGFGKSDATIADTFRLPLSFNKYWFPFSAAVRGFFLHRKNRYDAAWSVMANYAGFGALFFKLMHKDVPFVLTLQEGDPIEHILRRVGFFRPWFEKIFRRADRIQAISRFLADFAVSMGADQKRIAIIPNGVDVAHFEPNVHRFEKLSHPERILPVTLYEDDTVVITTSRLVEKNGIDTLIDALYYLPPTVKLLVVGSGPLEHELRVRASNDTLAFRVSFVGAIPHADLPPYLAHADIYVRPSRSEGLGSAFLEAMAAGLPVVATPVGGIPDFLEDTITGLFCEVDDPQSVAEKIALLANDKTLRQAIIANGRKLVAAQYDWSIVARRIEREVFMPLLHPRGPGR